MRYTTSIESLESRIAPALVVVNPAADILVGAAQKTATVELSQIVDPFASSVGHTLFKFTLNLDLDPNTAGIQNDTDLNTPGIQPPTVVIELFDDKAPLSVQNFIRYVQNPDTAADFIGTFFHRSITNFVLQGGGFNTSGQHISTFGAVHNEYSPDRSNVRGTVAMAKVGNDPNSATSEWFINVADNSSNLDNQNGGFTVFGQVVSGLNYVDQVVALPTKNFGGAFTNTPVQNYSSGNPTADNFISITSTTIVPPAAAGSAPQDATYEVLITNAGDSNPSDVVTGTLVNSSSLKLNFTGKAGVANVQVKIKNATETVVDNFLVTAQPNLTIEVASDSLPQILVPGDKGTITVQVNNTGGANYSGATDISLLLSKADGYNTTTKVAVGPDPTGSLLDVGTDVAVGSSNSAISLASGSSVQIAIPIKLAQQLIGGFDAYKVLAQVSPVAGTTELFTDDQLALDGGYHALTSQFGNVPQQSLGVLLSPDSSTPPAFAARAGVKLSYQVDTNTFATFSFTGAGAGRINQSGDAYDLVISGTNSSSVLNFVSPIHQAFRNIDIASPISAVNLGSVDVSGYITVSSGARTLNFGDVNGTDQLLLIGAFNQVNSVPVVLKFGSVTDLSLESDQLITSLTASKWKDSADLATPSGTRDRIAAPTLGKLSIAGDFESDLLFLRKTATTSISVKGAVTGATFTSGGSLGAVSLGSASDLTLRANASSLSIPGAVSDLVLDSTRAFGAVSLGSLTDATITAKLASLTVKGDVTGLDLTTTESLGALTFGSLSDSSIEARLTTFTVKGAMTGSTVITHSNVSAASIGVLQDSSFFAGTAARPASNDDFTEKLTISSFKVTQAFANSQVAAATIASIVVKNVNGSFTGENGFVADRVNSYVRDAQPARTNLSAANPLIDPLGDYRLTIL